MLQRRQGTGRSGGREEARERGEVKPRSMKSRDGRAHEEYSETGLRKRQRTERVAPRYTRRRVEKAAAYASGRIVNEGVCEIGTDHIIAD